MRVLVDDLQAHATSEAGEIDEYLSENLGRVRWHVGAALGFDTDNGHDDDQHRAWSYSALGTLRDIFAKRFADDTRTGDANAAPEPFGYTQKPVASSAFRYILNA